VETSGGGIMNDRIRELALQAGLNAPYGSDHEGLRDFDYRKFADLIVRECVTVLEQHHPYTIDPEAYHYAISLIEEHFGVE
jgi:hypothetical protein